MRLANPALFNKGRSIIKTPAIKTLIPVHSKTPMSVIGKPATGITVGRTKTGAQLIQTPGENYQAIKMANLTDQVINGTDQEMIFPKIAAPTVKPPVNKNLIFSAIGIGLALLLIFEPKGKKHARR